MITKKGKPKTNTKKQHRTTTKKQGTKRYHQEIKTEYTNAKLYKQQVTSRK